MCFQRLSASLIEHVKKMDKTENLKMSRRRARQLHFTGNFSNENFSAEKFSTENKKNKRGKKPITVTHLYNSASTSFRRTLVQLTR